MLFTFIRRKNLNHNNKHLGFIQIDFNASFLNIKKLLEIIIE